MNSEVLVEIFSTNKVIDKFGNSHDFRTGISQKDGEFLWKLIRDNEICNTIEIGCAFGISSLYICDALSVAPSPSHTIIDPHQNSSWHGIGIYNLERSGFKSYELIEKPSEIALPLLLQNGRRFSFAFIDGMHTFDHALLDFFYIDRLLDLGGIIVFDDVMLPSINRVARYVNNYPNYFLMGSAEKWVSPKSKALSAVLKILSPLANLFPNRISNIIFNDRILRPDASIGLNSKMVAFKKMTSTERRWNWYVPF